jgi:hypothetical protein
MQELIGYSVCSGQSQYVMAIPLLPPMHSGPIFFKIIIIVGMRSLVWLVYLLSIDRNNLHSGRKIR